MVQTLQPTQMSSSTSLEPVKGVVDNRLYRAGMQAPRLGALGTGVRGEAPLLVKGEHLDPGFGRVKYSLILIGASQLALQTAGA
jgi:hypothetical protein